MREGTGMLWWCFWGDAGHCAGPISCAAHGTTDNLGALITIQTKR